MKIVAALREAFSGWLKIIRNAPDGLQHFRLTMPGLATALVLFYLFAFLAVVVASLQFGVPTLWGFVEIMAMQSLWLVALLAGIHGTRFAVRGTGSVLSLFIPGIYALIAYLILGTLLSLGLFVLTPLLWFGLLFMFYRLGRIAGGWTRGVSAAFAALTVVLLVGLPMTLYMLATAPLPAA